MVTVVAFHAHPDDEVLLTGGTLARIAAAGHRVVIVVATDGHMGAATDHRAGERLDELRASAAVLGAARVIHLGYADSGHGPLLYPDPAGRCRFARAEVDEAGARLAELLREEHAAVLIGYDAAGGYGHRDHVKVHELGARAAELAATSPTLGGPATTVRVVAATRPRGPVGSVVGAVRRLRRRRGRYRWLPPELYSSRREITHRVDVRRFAAQKQAALGAHASQLTGTGFMARMMTWLTRVPAPVFGLLLGREWFVSGGAPRGVPQFDDVLYDRAGTA
ncbi:MAG: PIG-L deacetylase family protein [Frankia sp.]